MCRLAGCSGSSSARTCALA